MTEYTVRMMATARVAGYTTIEADSEEEAITKAEKLDSSDFTFEVDDDFYIDGDEVIFVDDPEWGGDPVEIDARASGEPFAWDAVNLVKDLAKIDDLANVRPLIERARGLLK
jgi:hypothetical protein